MPAATAHRYLIALGSNQRHGRHGAPRRVLAAALAQLGAEGVRVLAAAPAIETAPIGPSIRRYANTAALSETALEPEALLALIKRIERKFGRRHGGQRWRARVLDLDVVLWSGGAYPLPLQGRGKGWGRLRDHPALTSPTPTPPLKGWASLTIPHPLFRQRAFVLTPAAMIAPQWRDPLTGRNLHQLRARLTGPRPLPKRVGGRALSSVGRATDF